LRSVMRLQLILWALCLWASDAPLTERVLVVYNAHSRDSKKVANHYMQARGIPRANGCALKRLENLPEPVPPEELDKLVR